MPLTEETLNYNRIQRAAGSKIFDRGLMYYHQKRVTVETVDEEFATCLVRGSTTTYEVAIELEGSSLYFSCNCPYATGGAICKHEVAAALAIRDHLRTHVPVNWRSQLTRIVQSTKTIKQPVPQPYILLFSLHSVYEYGYTSWKLTPYMLPVRVIPEEAQQYIQTLTPERLGELILSIPDLSMALRAPYHALNSASCVNAPPQTVSVANYLIDKSKYYSYVAVSGTDLRILAGLNVIFFTGSQAVPVQHVLHCYLEQGKLELVTERSPDGIHLKLFFNIDGHSLCMKRGETQLITKNPTWIMAEQGLFELEDHLPEHLLQSLLETPELIIPKKDESDFLEKYYLQLSNLITVKGDAVTWQEVKAEPVKRLYLSDNEEKGKSLLARLRFGYGEYELPYQSGLPLQHVQNIPDTWTLIRITRDPKSEREAFESLASAETGLKRAPSPASLGTFSLRARIHPVDFLISYVPRLVAMGFEIYGEDKLKVGKVNRNKPSITFNVSSGIDWFDVQAVVTYGDLEVSFKEIRSALRKREFYIKLADGSMGQIPEEWIERYKHLFALGEETDQGVRLSNHHVTVIDQLLLDSDRVRSDLEYKQRSQRLKDFSGIPSKEIPKGFIGELRPYQKAGFDWLHFLHEYRFGGCLADDMGLGKTIQALVFFQSLVESDHTKTASLLVLPKSLLVNWQREAARFTPHLHIFEYFKNDRKKEIAIFNAYDLVVTTYGVMLRDIEILRHYPFHYVLLDESQAIKNPLAQSAKAARLLTSDHRLVLTGTPVENSTYELWSQFAFLNPGLLGNLEYFKEQFSAPIEKQGEEKAAQFLRKMVYPFILRRTKDQVAPELPPRTERFLYSDMEPAQRKLYNRTRDYYRGLLMGLIEREGMNDARMKILEGLLRLRQICNHPKLMDVNFHGESAKFELLLETLETLDAEEHKALVFSQFVEMLKLVRQELDRRQIPYAYLDGRTRNRQECVDTFQNDPKISFFLISLKAGGVGLNLTAADYVIHIDPWWNPAVEMQATDRTHRIGQDKPVFVYKMIVRDTVEEKILQLQERKKHLVDQIITTDSGFFKALSTEDVKGLFS